MQLEKAVREIREEIALVKFTSQKKIADAQSLEANLEEKSLEIEAKLHAADAKLAEANRKKSHADRDLEEVEARQRRIEKEKQYFENEYGIFFSFLYFILCYTDNYIMFHCFGTCRRKAREKQLKEQEDSLQDWDKKLKESQSRVTDLQKSVNEREERANLIDKHWKTKEEELEEAKKTVESTKITLKTKEDDITKRLNELRSKEKVTL
jgi:peptidoglycan hydrolase CwlO-like protein